MQYDNDQDRKVSEYTAFNDAQCTEYSVDLYNKSAKVYLNLIETLITLVHSYTFSVYP